MKKQQRKLHLTKSKIIHFKTLHLFGGTDITTNPYNNVTIIETDCPNTLHMSCYEATCSTHGRPRTREDSPCGNTTGYSLQSNNDCVVGSVNSNC
ncbi:hypothetical protein [uncultured Kordia sp.]|uniref:hypothetical protein n=1 Tax=uncultured Kordia sp. TaxID=507699 RepID=UPI0026304537|nr:hypothetical protein [uncultured Kordia sp.]